MKSPLIGLKSPGKNLVIENVDCPDDVWRLCIVRGYRGPQDYDEIVVMLGYLEEPENLLRVEVAEKILAALDSGPTEMAFWRYSTGSMMSFRGGAITKRHATGRVETEEYGPGNTFTPVIVRPIAEGRAVLAAIKQVENRCEEAMNRLRRDAELEIGRLMGVPVHEVES